MSRNLSGQWSWSKYGALGAAIVALVAATGLQGRPGLAQIQPIARYAPDGGLLLPEGFEAWIFVGSNLGLGYNPGIQAMTAGENARQRPAQMFHNVYINSAAFTAYLRDRTFPDGTVLVMDVYEASTREPRGIVNRGTFNGRRTGVEVAVKNSRRPDGARTDWAYYDFTDPSGLGRLLPQAKAKPDADCYACHKTHAGDDNVWVQFYPTLRRIKQPE